MSLNIASGVIEVSSPAGDVLFGTNTGMIYRAQRVQGLIRSLEVWLQMLPVCLYHFKMVIMLQSIST